MPIVCDKDNGSFRKNPNNLNLYCVKCNHKITPEQEHNLYTLIKNEDSATEEELEKGLLTAQFKGFRSKNHERTKKYIEELGLKII